MNSDQNMLMNRNGFTLIELSIAMVIIGLLVGFGTSLVVPLSTRAKRMESSRAVDAAMEAVIGYAAAHDGNLPTVEQFPGVIKKYKDAWQKPIYYRVDSRFTDSNMATGTVCTRKDTYLTIRQCNDSACTAPVVVPDVAFVILSGGSNTNNQTIGALAVSAPETVDVYEGDIENVDNETSDMDRPEVYDDLPQWITLHELKSRIQCFGSRMEILNQTLPPGKTGTTYNAAVYLDGGVPFSSGGSYKWCIQTGSGSPPSGVTFRNDDNTASIGLTTDGADLPEGSAAWVQSDFIRIVGTPASSGCYLLTVWARDNNSPGNDPACSSSVNPDNCTRKSFVLTIDP